MAASGQKLLEIPKDCICPISQMLMQDPVVCADGHSYDRQSIEQWQALGHNTSPMTNVALPHLTLTPNINLKNVIESLTERMPAMQQQQMQQLRERQDLEAIVLAVAENQGKQLQSVGPRSPAARGVGPAAPAGVTTAVADVAVGATAAARAFQQCWWSSVVTRAESLCRSPLPFCPLRPTLHDDTQRTCVVQNLLRSHKQQLPFDIFEPRDLGGVPLEPLPLFRVGVSDLPDHGFNVSSSSSISVVGYEEMAPRAYLLTDELWKGIILERPAMRMERSDGRLYSIQKGDNGDYCVKRGWSTLLVYYGDFAAHNIQVADSARSIVATTMPMSSGEYQVCMQTCADARLIILGLLAIDMFESTDFGAQ